jgi:hypothetical protein
MRSSFLIDLSMAVAAFGGPNERHRFGAAIVDEGGEQCKAMHAEKVNEFRTAGAESMRGRGELTHKKSGANR